MHWLVVRYEIRMVLFVLGSFIFWFHIGCWKLIINQFPFSSSILWSDSIPAFPTRLMIRATHPSRWVGVLKPPIQSERLISSLLLVEVLLGSDFKTLISLGSSFLITSWDSSSKHLFRCVYLWKIKTWFRMLEIKPAKGGKKQNLNMRDYKYQVLKLKFLINTKCGQAH